MVNITSKWRRKEITLKGADPTVVVQWAHGDIEIEEFQTVIITRVAAVPHNTDSYMGLLGAALHKALEELHSHEEELRINDASDEINARIYGGE